jgi:hypothetical protein
MIEFYHSRGGEIAEAGAYLASGYAGSIKDVAAMIQIRYRGSHETLRGFPWLRR